jgi:hypothetical protein
VKAAILYVRRGPSSSKLDFEGSFLLRTMKIKENPNQKNSVITVEFQRPEKHQCCEKNLHFEDRHCIRLFLSAARLSFSP